MSIRTHCICGLIVLVASLSVLVPCKAATEEKAACATSQCHPSLIAKQAALPKGHEDCAHCHQRTDETKKHPDSEGASFTLTKDVCQECHQTIVDYPYLHPPVAAGDCLVCHTFHSSTPALLIDSKDHLLCYNCHQPVTSEEDTVLHGDIDKKCGACHTIHGSFFKHLLTGPYSTDFFNDYDEKHYALCFQCHKIDLLLHPNTSYNTNFRNGQKNLHFVHVNRKNRGRACKLCHVVHAGKQEKLMAEKVSFGDWEMPINFVGTVNGGQCAPGCHAPASYDRNRGTSQSSPAPSLPAGEEPLKELKQ